MIGISSLVVWSVLVLFWVSFFLSEEDGALVGLGRGIVGARIDIEKSSLLNEGYRRCLYIDLKCEQCGCWRMCIEPETDVACPKRRQLCLYTNGTSERADTARAAHRGALRCYS